MRVAVIRKHGEADVHREQVTPGENFKALEVARTLGLTVAVNIIRREAFRV